MNNIYGRPTLSKLCLNFYGIKEYLHIGLSVSRVVHDHAAAISISCHRPEQVEVVCAHRTSITKHETSVPESLTVSVT